MGLETLALLVGGLAAGSAVSGEVSRRREDKAQKALLASAPTAESLEAKSREEAKRRRKLLQKEQTQTQLTPTGQGLAATGGRQTLGGQ